MGIAAPRAGNDMNVSNVGFKLELAKNISIGEFFQEMEAFEDKESNVYGRIHVPYFDTASGYIIGSILSYRGSKKILTTERDQHGDLIVKRSELSDGENGTEVCMFCINPATMKGLMYCYFGSITLPAFQALLQRIHTKVKARKRKEYRNELTQFSTKKIANLSDKLEKQFKGRLVIRPLATPADLNSILKNFAEIQTIIVRSEDMLSDAGIYKPIDQFARSASMRIDIEKSLTTAAGKFAQSIKSVFNHYNSYKKAEKFMLLGIAHNGDEISRIIGENNEEFGKQGYDEYVDKLPSTKWKDYKSCAALKQLLKQIKSTTIVFGQLPGSKWKFKSKKDLGIN